jgi:hypothetical protein
VVASIKGREVKEPADAPELSMPVPPPPPPEILIAARNLMLDAAIAPLNLAAVRFVKRAIRWTRPRRNFGVDILRWLYE